MSNPLLKPNDPRFQKPDIPSAEGKNPFADGAQQPKPPSETADAFSGASTGEARPFVPKFETQDHSRPILLFVLASIGWGAALIGAFSLTGWFSFGWISPLLGVIPAGAAWMLAHEELKAISAGVIPAQAREKSRHAYWLGFMALVLCVSIIAAMIYRGLNFFPDL